MCDLKKHDADVFRMNFLHERGHIWHLEDSSRKRSSTFYGLYWYDCLTLRITVRFTITWQNRNILSYPCRILILDFRYCISLIVQVAILAASVLQNDVVYHCAVIYSAEKHFLRTLQNIILTSVLFLFRHK